APVYGGGPSMEDFTAQTPLTVGSPEQVVERYLTMAEHVGDYQRQMFLMDHAGLPQKTVLEQIELLGTEVVPVLRRELEAPTPTGPPPPSPRTPPSTTATDSRPATTGPACAPRTRRRPSDDQQHPPDPGPDRRALHSQLHPHAHRPADPRGRGGAGHGRRRG